MHVNPNGVPGCPPDLRSHAVHGVDELEDRVEDDPQMHLDFGGDAECESEIEALWNR